MQNCLIILCSCSFILVGCVPEDVATPSGDTKKHIPIGEVPATDEKELDAHLPDESEIRTYIQPWDASTVVGLESWPPLAGPSPLRLIVAGDKGINDEFNGTIQYRIVSTQNSSDKWIPMSRTGPHTFVARASLKVGSCFLQFRKTYVDGRQLDLMDWKIDVDERK